MAFLLSPRDQRQMGDAVGRCREDVCAFAEAFFGMRVAGRQAEWLAMDGTVQTAVAGRRFGKSLCSLVKAVHACVTARDQEWYVTAPSIDQASIYFQELDRRLNESSLLRRLMVPNSLKYHPFPEVRFRSGSILRARSTTLDGKYLRGKGAHGIVVTEAAFVKDVVWNEVIRAMLLDRKGRAVVETTPNGTGDWTYRLWKLGREDGTGYYRSFHATCYDNPRLDQLEIERIRREIPDIAFRQEYLAEWTDDDAAVFPWSLLQDVFDDYRMPGRPVDGRRYSIGVDLAKYRDWTVICVLDTTGVDGQGRPAPYTVAEWHRFQGVAYTEVAARVNDLAERYHAQPHLDATGVGDAVAEQVKGVRAIVFTPGLRDDLISRLVVAVEQRGVMLPASLTDLRDEMRYFRRVEHGQRVRPEHAPDKHDDGIFALALAVFGANSGWAGLTEYYRRLKEGAMAPT